MKTVRRRMADGSVKTYRYQRKTILAGTLGALIQEYRRSPEFARLKPNTLRTYLRAIGHLEVYYKVPVVDLKRRHIVKLRDHFQATPALANQIVAVFSVLMNYAIQMEYRETNPAFRLPWLGQSEYRRWTDEEIEFALRAFPARFGRAIMLALYTGQRMGDVVRMTWADYDGEGIQVAQEKTGAKLWIACHADLRAALSEWRSEGRSATAIVVDSHGKPYRPDTFSTAFSAEVRKHARLRGCVFHGLRKTAAAKLAESGCTTHEIAAITGHRSLAMLQLYTREAEQKSRSRAAILKLENFRGKRSAR